jgi:integrase
MPRKATEWTPLAVKRCTASGLYGVGGVDGLYLQVLPTGGKSWVLRFSSPTRGRRRDMGLGGWPAVSLSDAREAARVARQKVRAGIDPIDDADAALARAKAERNLMTFREAAEGYMDAHERGLRNAKHAAQWRSTLKTYAYPVFGDKAVRDVELQDVLRVIEPLWTSKTATATRVRGRIESVLDWASARGLRSGPNPAAWKGNIDKILPSPSKVSPAEHHPAVPVDEAPTVMRQLETQAGIAALALRFTILTASRQGPVRGATWSEVDGTVWRVPASRMKAGREHRVTLSNAALEVLHQAPLGGPGDLIFPSPKGGALTDMAMNEVLRRLGVPAVPHGWRSTFMDWAAERTGHPIELARIALAHIISDKTEAAYRRGDMLERRREIMNDWATFLGARGSQP